MDALRAAVAAGADAVYLGGKRFGARRFAANFSDEELRDAIRYCHLRNVRVYVTVNTLMHDRELPEALAYLIDLYDSGVDAVLLQDRGLAKLARETIPGLALHASTQMTVHNTDGVREAAGLGFSRVVLARELTLPEIDRIADETRDLGIGLEVFAHGALCYSYSGQCLLSSCIGGRSGNRGSCAQPCRKPYELVAAVTGPGGNREGFRRVPVRERYLLSTKDLCTLPVLERIAASPVASLKIEGRMRTPEYVAVVVSIYRKLLDRIRDGKGEPDPEDLFFLEMAFSRGFTRGYLSSSPARDVMGRDLPKNRGVPVGTVLASGRGSVVLDIPGGRRVPLRKGDGLVIRAGDREEDEIGFVLSRDPVQEQGTLRLPLPLPLPATVPKGSEVFLTRSAAFEEYAAGVLRSGQDRHGQVPVRIRFAVGPDGVPVLTGTLTLPDGTSRSHTVTGESPLLPAKTRPLTPDAARTQIGKTSGTVVSVAEFSANIAGDWFAPPGILNRMRRDLISGLEEILVRVSSPGAAPVAEARNRWDGFASGFSRKDPGSGRGQPDPAGLGISLYTDTVDGVRAAFSAGADRVYFEPQVGMPACPPSGNGRREWYREYLSRIVADLAEAAGIARPAGTRLVWKLPEISRDDFLESAVDILPGVLSRGVAGCMADDSGAGTALRKRCGDCELFGGAGLNVFNADSVSALSALFSVLTLSPELSLGDIRDLASRLPGSGYPPLEIIVQGNLPVMVAEDRLLSLLVPPEFSGTRFGLRDGTGRVFPVAEDSECRTRIRNAVELCLIDRLPGILAAGAGSVAIDARGRPPEYIDRMVRAYRAAAECLAREDPDRDARLFALKEEIRDMAWGGITTGHFGRKPEPG